MIATRGRFRFQVAGDSIWAHGTTPVDPALVGRLEGRSLVADPEDEDLFTAMIRFDSESWAAEFLAAGGLRDAAWRPIRVEKARRDGPVVTCELRVLTPAPAGGR